MKVGYTQVKDFWNEKTRGWKSLTGFGMSYHPSNGECRELIMNNIPWRPDGHEDHIRIGDWITNPTPPTGCPLD
jgi:hypothetical protein